MSLLWSSIAYFYFLLIYRHINILSIACLENRKHNNGYYQTYKIALCGTNRFKITERIKKLEPNQISLALDNDHAGQLATKIIYHELSKITQPKSSTTPKKTQMNFWFLFFQQKIKSI